MSSQRRRRGIPLIPILFLLITVFTLAEIALIFVLAHLTGWLTTILIAIVTAIIGAVMIRGAGLSVVRSFQTQIQSGKFPGEAIAEGALILVGGAFLMTPGLITDVIGLTTLIPFTRKLYARMIVRWAQRNIRAVPMGGAAGMANPFGGGFGAPGEGPHASEPKNETGGPTIFDVPPDVEDATTGSRKKADDVDVEFRRTE